MAPLRPRHITTFANEALDTFPAVIIEGARQVGKSTTAGELAHGRESVVLTLDDEDVRAAAIRDPATFVAQAGSGTLVVDEIQRAPDLLLAIKASIDRDRRPGRFLLTGSSDMLRMPGAPESLAGRAVTVALDTFSQGELLNRVDDFVSRVANNTNVLTGFETDFDRQALVDRIVTGGYPEAQSLSTRMRDLWFDAYATRLVTRDSRELTRASDPARLAALLRLIAANQSGELVRARLARDASMPETAASVALDLLQTMFLIGLLRPWTPNLTSREVGRPKAIVMDPGLAARLARLPASALASPLGSPHLGGQVEGFVVSELRKQSRWASRPHELFHFRDRAGLEVDVVAELDDGRVVCIEVKAGATAKSEHFSALASLRDRLGDRFVAGIVLNTSQRALPFGDRLWAVPVPALWEV
ncbi:ATP-binding protein [Humibacter sp. RRB41]|uniref:ATP-binding protein n=1 Tax=Humibacter sp. RRB41 TaxID=2919946 RepID=UPI001FA9CB53|nr:ATP-binding protein [Humibacter sp. RRB41]